MKFKVNDRVKYIGGLPSYKNWTANIQECRYTPEDGHMYKIKFGKHELLWFREDGLELVVDTPSKLTGNPFYAGKVNW